MKITYLYVIPIIWVTLGILYARSLPKDGFTGVAEVFLTWVSGLIILIGILVYHAIMIFRRRRRDTSDKG